jgi:hypothetical protein
MVGKQSMPKESSLGVSRAIGQEQIRFGNDKQGEHATAKATTEILSKAQNDDRGRWDDDRGQWDGYECRKLSE